MNNFDRKGIKAKVDGAEVMFSANELTRALEDDKEIEILDDNMLCPRCETGVVYFNCRAEEYRSGFCNCCVGVNETKVVVRDCSIYVNDRFMMIE